MSEVRDNTDKGVRECERVIRRLNSRYHKTFDKNLGCWRLTSVAISLATNDKKMSVDFEDCIVDQGKAPSDVVVPPNDGAIVFSVSIVRGVELDVERQPVPSNECHGYVFSKCGLANLKRDQVRHIVEGSEWVVPLPDVKLVYP